MPTVDWPACNGLRPFALSTLQLRAALLRLPRLLSSLLLVFSLGCGRQTELTYTPSEDVRELPQPMQVEIRDLLTTFYGTPSNPRLMVLAENGQPSNEESEGEVDQYDFHLESRLDPDRLKLGAQVYQLRCTGCHGVTGDGQGPAAPFLDPKPRDYRRGIFKFTSTGRNKPRKSDLIYTVKYGARGTSMPAFRWLPDDELSAVVDYVIVLSQRGETERKLVVLAEEEELEFAAEDALAVYQSWKEAPSELVQPATPPPPVTEEAIQSGRHAFLVQGCAKCHGPGGRGFTQEPLEDDWGNRIYAADLTSGMLHGGRREIDIYRRIYTGINGTPMPAFGPQFSPVFADNPDKIWHLTYYVLALAEGREFPAATMEEANRMALEEARKNAAVPEPMPDPNDTPANETPKDQPPDDAPPTGGNAEDEDPRRAIPRPPVPGRETTGGESNSAASDTPADENEGPR